VDNLAKVAFEADIIHGHHRHETMAALIRFPNVPAIYFCHGWTPWQEQPLLHPRILRYVAVDDTCRDRLLEEGIPEGKIRVVLNFVDFKRFWPRSRLPEHPRRALLFSNYARRDKDVPVVQQACAQAGIELDVVGSGVGRPVEQPEKILGRYDLVFARGRCALEAMAVGAAVVVISTSGIGGMVTTAKFDRLRSLNFGQRSIQKPLTRDGLLQEIACYNAQDAAAVSRRLREEAALDSVANQLQALYREVIKEFQSVKRPAAEDESRIHAGFIAELIEWRERLQHEVEKPLSLILKKLQQFPLSVRLSHWCAQLGRRE
jgi:hypothetical protein